MGIFRLTAASIADNLTRLGVGTQVSTRETENKVPGMYYDNFTGVNSC